MVQPLRLGKSGTGANLAFALPAPFDVTGPAPRALGSMGQRSRVTGSCRVQVLGCG